MKRNIINIFIVGFALFSMLFGAGNVIFPPYLGLGCGARWFEGFLYYYLADIGLALTCLFAMQRSGGYRAITIRLGRLPSELLNCVIVLCIGPLVGIPRTAASIHEMSVRPLFPGVDPVLFAFFFFAMVAVLCMKETAVVDIIGKILTPVLIGGLLVLIIRGSVSPIGPIPEQVLVSNVPVTGVNAGYQTMDVLAVVIFGILISKSVRDKGYTQLKQQNRIIYGAGAVAGVCLLGMYLGLAYLGVTASAYFDLSVDHTFLITSIVEILLGHTGTVIFSAVVALACITTAVALVSASSDYFSALSGGKVPYGAVVAVICMMSAGIATMGLNDIIRVAGPILDVVYPPTLFVIILSFFDRWIKNDWVFRMGAIGACIVSLCSVLAEFGLPFGAFQNLPFYIYGFGWVLPALVFAAIGALFPRPDRTEIHAELDKAC